MDFFSKFRCSTFKTSLFIAFFFVMFFCKAAYPGAYRTITTPGAQENSAYLPSIEDAAEWGCKNSVEYKNHYSWFSCGGVIPPSGGYSQYYWGYYHNGVGPYRYYPISWYDNVCAIPFSSEGGECVLYCPPDKTLDYTLGRCVGGLDIVPEKKQCPGPSVPTTAGNPVIISSGEKEQVEEPDLISGGPYPIVIQRTYKSFLAGEARSKHDSDYQKWYFTLASEEDKSAWTRYVQPSGYVGPAMVVTPWWKPSPIKGDKTVTVAGQKQWQFNFSYALLEGESGNVDITMPGDEIHRFLKNSEGTYSPRNASSYSLGKLSGDTFTGWLLTSPGEMKYYFNETGQLVKTENVAGFHHYLTHNSRGYVDSISDDFGHKFSMAYADEGALITSVASNNGDRVDYSYDSYGNIQQVFYVKSSGTSVSRKYHYEDARFPYALTGITDQRGIRYASWTYDDQGRVVESVHAGGAEKTTFIYGKDSTTVTNALGKSDVYHYSQVAGERRLVQVEGQASTSCLAANKDYSYYDNGLIKSKTDWKGSKTTYEYNSRGLVIKKKEASGLPEEKTTVIEWHPVLPVPVKITEGNRIATYSYDSNGRLLTTSLGG